ncbi:MAG: alanine--glyoxylate aminotransferase family protein, partial [Euryarchaeota archaeon]|nr:alanine--glyoxylate aminotransferase family protein [Euryarchaeota archaeon]
MTAAKTPLLLLPGPVPVHPRILRAMGRPMINHRGAEFAGMLREVTRGLQGVLGTRHDVLVLSASGSGAMEAAVDSLAGPGDAVLCLVNGKFGARFAEMAARHAEAARYEVEWGRSFNLGEVESRLRQSRPKVVTLVHNETSTGILNPAPEIARLVRDAGAMLILDTVTTAGGDHVQLDKWGVDVAVTASQKCLGAPPGLSAVAVSPGAWERMDPGVALYLDLRAYRKSAEKGQTPYT